jgi:hypothetical protein
MKKKAKTVRSLAPKSTEDAEEEDGEPIGSVELELADLSQALSAYGVSVAKPPYYVDSPMPHGAISGSMGSVPAGFPPPPGMAGIPPSFPVVMPPFTSSSSGGSKSGSKRKK